MELAPSPSIVAIILARKNATDERDCLPLPLRNQPGLPGLIRDPATGFDDGRPVLGSL